MPERPKSEPDHEDWSRQLERDRMRRVKEMNDPWLPGPGAAVSATNMGALAPSPKKTTSSRNPDTQNDWGKRLERQRMQMVMSHGNPWLPGPGAAGATAKTLSGGLGGAIGSKAGKSKDKPQLPMMLKAITAFLPPSVVDEFEKNGGKPLSEAMWKIHEIFVGSIKLSPFSLLTAGAFHIWWYAANFKGTRGLPRLGIGDLFRILLYDAVVFLLCMIILFVIVILVLIAYVIISTLSGSTEFAGLIADMR
ncbi:MAG: hypothetical protein U9Q03_01010 [Patescibacteria group bacterium]|nr:hypothetical protein [Patescibacteria group bacterium]